MGVREEGLGSETLEVYVFQVFYGCRVPSWNMAVLSLSTMQNHKAIDTWWVFCRWRIHIYILHVSIGGRQGQGQGERERYQEECIGGLPFLSELMKHLVKCVSSTSSTKFMWFNSAYFFIVSEGGSRTKTPTKPTTRHVM